MWHGVGLGRSAALVVVEADGPPPKAAGDDAFASVDQSFRGFYARARARTLSELSPLIVVELDGLTLIRDGKRTRVETIPPIYHRLKALSHIPLAIYVALGPYGPGPIDDRRLADLAAFRTQVNAASQALGGAELTPAQAERARNLTAKCKAFLDQILRTKTNDPAALQALTRSTAPIVLANAADAAKAQIDGYHTVVSRWRREIGPGEWAKLRVVVIGLRMPHRRNTAVQYFAKLLGEKGESRRLVYAEELAGEPAALNLLATHQLDSMLSFAFFDDRERMEFDLLGNAAAVYLDGLDLSR
jgi:hypothetical protein